MKGILFSVCLLVGTIGTQAQTADEVIARYAEAMGGKEKLSSIQTLHLVGISTMPNGNEVTTEIWKENNKLFRRETAFGMSSMKILITPDGGWQTNMRSGGAFESMAEQMLKNQRHEMETTPPFFNYAEKGHKVELMGRETVDAKENWKLKVTTRDGRELTYFIDAGTHYINRLSFRGRTRGGTEETEVVITYANYDKTTDGYIFPFTQSTSGGFGGTMTFEKIEVNPKLSEKLYKAE